MKCIKVAAALMGGDGDGERISADKRLRLWCGDGEAGAGIAQVEDSQGARRVP